MSKKTVIVGATPNPARYAFTAAQLLTEFDHPIVPIGIKQGLVGGEEILDIRSRPEIEDVDTITMYIGPENQPAYYDYLLGLRPKRIIFNPGTENPQFERMAQAKGIETEQACTLVLLKSGQY